ncbi:G-protein coupled bile acid receptor 1 [Colossoma macropomum]|uniref:G-protein coupled bile acid receptor 1 n=1 Tax=Colossoma macropomum TaxID=42526 RepID=UPI001863D7FF|nr:G-protein coupled bile acid receptor 1 [Colossoma macropomum]
MTTMVCNDTRSNGQEAQLIYAITLPLSATIILANLLIILGIACTRQLHNPRNYLYLSLLVADLCMGVALPFIPWMSLIRPLGFSSCLMVHIFPNFLFLAFIFNLVLVYYERYLSIVSPLLPGHFWPRSRFVPALLAVWLLPLVYALLPAFGWNNRYGLDKVGSGCCPAANDTVHPGCPVAIPKDNCCIYHNVFPDTFIYLEVYGLLVPAIVSIAAMTGRVLWITRGQMRDIQRQQRAVNSAEQRRKLELRYARCVATVSLAFLACWLPYIVYTHLCMVFLQNHEPQVNRTAHIVLSCTGVGGMSTVPLLLGLANREYTNPARRLLRKVWHRWHRTQQQRDVNLQMFHS